MGRKTLRLALVISYTVAQLVPNSPMTIWALSLLILVALVMLMNPSLHRMFGMPMIRGWVRGTVIVGAMFVLGVLSNFERAYAPTARPATLAQKVWASENLPGALVASGTMQEVRVWEVTDGSTLRTSVGTVRLLGVAAPAGGDCFAREATARLAELTLGKTVLLHSDPSIVDAEGAAEALRYVEIDGEDIGALLVIGGSARVADGNFGLQQLYSLLEDDVRSRGEGLWSACPA